MKLVKWLVALPYGRASDTRVSSIVNAGTIIRVILGTALVASLFGAGWSVYRRLPGDGANVATNSAAETEVTIVKYDALELNGKGNDIVIEAYRVDFSTIRREFLEQPHGGMRFEDFLARRMQGKTPVRTQLDSNGRAVVMLAPGNWWIHATMANGDESIEWRLPITVTGGKQTVALTAQNVDERSKKF